MKIKTLIIEIGIKNLDKIKKEVKHRKIDIIYLSSFLDIVDIIHLENVNIIVLSDFRGIKSTIGYLKMFMTTNPQFKIIILSNEIELNEDIIYYYIQRGADSVISIYNVEEFKNRLLVLFTLINNDNEISQNWCNCTKKVIRFIKDNYHEHNDLVKKMTCAAKYSISAIYHCVKKDTGLSIGEWIKKLRMNGAIELLKFSEFPIKLIYKKIGYKSVQGFLKTFKKFTGKTPKDYRNQIKNLNI